MHEPRRGSSDASAEMQAIVQLAREASIELNVQDLKHLEASCRLLPPGKRVYISHLPKQRWVDTWTACREVYTAGFDPIPHVPVRLIEDEAALDRILESAANARAQELLLISGDYSRPAGPYSVVADVLRAGKLNQHGFARVSLAGHPEGHPTVALEEIRRAELEKALLAERLNLQTTFVTQFFFESVPFLQWAVRCRAQGMRTARLIAGLSGPARVPALLKFARRCGIGRSVRALAARPGEFTRLLRDYEPEGLLRDLAGAYQSNVPAFDGLHFFCFGGYLQTCEWLKDMTSGCK